MGKSVGRRGGVGRSFAIRQRKPAGAGPVSRPDRGLVTPTAAASGRGVSCVWLRHLGAVGVYQSSTASSCSAGFQPGGGLPGANHGQPAVNDQGIPPGLGSSNSPGSALLGAVYRGVVVVWGTTRPGRLLAR